MIPANSIPANSGSVNAGPVNAGAASAGAASAGAANQVMDADRAICIRADRPTAPLFASPSLTTIAAAAIAACASISTARWSAPTR